VVLGSRLGWVADSLVNYVSTLSIYYYSNILIFKLLYLFILVDIISSLISYLYTYSTYLRSKGNKSTL
jgi:hypothetical protein